mgnify:CR=1 FL=1
MGLSIGDTRKYKEVKVMNTILFANGTSENHGCEAIMQSTVPMLKNKFNKIYCSTTHLDYELNNTELPTDCEWVEYSYFRKPTYLNRAISKFERTIFKTNKYAESKPWLHNVNEVYKHCSFAISVGGDNYCNGSYDWLYMLHNEAKRNGLKTILWGASVDDEPLKNKDMRIDLQKYDAICARETLTYKTLTKFHSNVKLYPDPAFLLDSVNMQWPGYENDNELPEFIGINVSPTIISCEKEKGILIKTYKKLIEYILKETTYNIALIPHVIYQKRWGDYEILRTLYNEYSYTNRLVLIPDNNCFVLKGYISKCRSFITARTHASVAAYSTCVPTVVMGYSIKAQGISEDLFGTTEHYVIPVQDVDNDKMLVKEFCWLEDNHDIIKKHLQSIMPDYKKRAERAIDVIDELQ